MKFSHTEASDVDHRLKKFSLESHLVTATVNTVTRWLCHAVSMSVGVTQSHISVVLPAPLSCLFHRGRSNGVRVICPINMHPFKPPTERMSSMLLFCFKGTLPL